MRLLSHLLPHSNFSRWIYIILFAGVPFTLELLIFYYQLHNDFPDRITFYFFVPMLALFFHRAGISKKSVTAALLLSLVLSSILVIHGVLIYGNHLGFTLENLFFLQSEGAVRELLLISTGYFLKTIFLIAVVTVLVPILSILLFMTLNPVLRQSIPKSVQNIFFVLCLLFGAVTFAPLQDTLTLFQQLRTELDIWTLSPETYKTAGIKLFPGDPEEVKASPGRNLVFIILESTELTYLDQKLFPGLLPNLSAFARKAQVFKNISMARNAHLTHSAMYSLMTGAYMTGSHDLRRGEENYNPNIGCRLSSFPKVLNQAGYRQYFLVGCSGNFAGIENVVKGEMYDTVWFGRDRSYEADKWTFALRDSKVFEQAWTFFRKAAAEKKPFNITLLTIDAHGPDGFYSPSEPAAPLPPSPQTHLYNAMYASDSALGKFLQRIAAHPAAAETCIVIVSDHLAHHFTRSIPILEQNPDRKMLFLIHNSVQKEFRPDIAGKTFDVAPTTLAAMGVKHDYRFPVGENLYGTPSPERLHDDISQEYLLKAYVHLKSRHPAKLPCDLQIESMPYPLLRAGNFLLPLHCQGIIDFPKENEFLYLPLPADRKLWNEVWERTSGLNAFEKVSQKLPEYFFLTVNTAATAQKYHLPDKKGWVAGLRLNGKTRIKYFPATVLPRFSAEEIKSMLK